MRTIAPPIIKVASCEEARTQCPEPAQKISTLWKELPACPELGSIASPGASDWIAQCPRSYFQVESLSKEKRRVKEDGLEYPAEYYHSRRIFPGTGWQID